MHFGQMLARAMGADMSSKFGDIWHTPERDADWLSDPVLTEALKLAPWWAKRLGVRVRYRPDETSPDHKSNPYNSGTLTLLYRMPGQLLGPYLTRSRRMVEGEYFRVRDFSKQAVFDE